MFDLSRLPSKLVVNKIAESNALNNRVLVRESLLYLFVHETSLCIPGPDNPEPIQCEDLDGVSLARVFKTMPKPWPDGLGTGGLCPYTFLIRKDKSATVEQMLPLFIRGAHAQKYNPVSISVAVVGHFNKEQVLDEQLNKLIQLCVALYPINKDRKSVV